MKNMFWTMMLVFLSGTVAIASDGPDISLKKDGWLLKKGVEIKDGVLTINGDVKYYRQALRVVPVSKFRKKRFYCLVKVKTGNIKLGKKPYCAPKVKIYYEKKRDTKKVKLIKAAQGDGWVSYFCPYELLEKNPAGNIVIELSMQNCEGTTKFKDVEISYVRPESGEK